MVFLLGCGWLHSTEKRIWCSASGPTVAVCGCVLFIRSRNTLCKCGNWGSVWSVLCYTRQRSKRRCRKTWAKHNALLSAQKKNWSTRRAWEWPSGRPFPCVDGGEGGVNRSSSGKKQPRHSWPPLVLHIADTMIKTTRCPFTFWPKKYTRESEYILSLNEQFLQKLMLSSETHVKPYSDFNARLHTKPRPRPSRYYIQYTQRWKNYSTKIIV